MSLDEQHIALPKLMGAPAYARPPRPVEPVERPIDLDDLPIEAARTPDDLELAVALPPPAGVHYGAPGPAPNAPVTAVAPMPGAVAMVERPPEAAPPDAAPPEAAPHLAAPPAGNGQGSTSPEARPFSLKGLARYLSGK